MSRRTLAEVRQELADIKKERRQLQRDISLLKQEKYFDSKLQAFQNIHNYGTLAIKSLLTFNGGAIVGLGAFLGNIITHVDKSMRVCSLIVEDAFLWFSYGACASLFCWGLAYLNQRLLHESDQTQTTRIRVGKILLNTNIGIAMLGLFFFYLGTQDTINFFHCLTAS